jgi:hypothetical protein
MTTEQIKREIRSLRACRSEAARYWPTMTPSRRLQIEPHLTRRIKRRPCATAFASASKRCRIGRPLWDVAGLKTPHGPSPLCGRIPSWLTLEARQLFRTPHDYLAIVIRCRRQSMIFVLCNPGRSPLLQLQICQFVTVRLVSENQVGA